MEVAPFFVDFHHFLSIFTIFYQFSRFTHFCRDLHFVAIYALFPQFFLAKIAFSATSHVFCMYGEEGRLVESVKSLEFWNFMSCQVANPGESVAKIQCNISRTISRLKVQRTEKSSLAFSCTSSHKQGKINCGASSEPDFIQNYFLWSRMVDFFDNHNKCRKSSFLRQRIHHF